MNIQENQAFNKPRSLWLKLRDLVSLALNSLIKELYNNTVIRGYTLQMHKDSICIQNLYFLIYKICHDLEICNLEFSMWILSDKKRPKFCFNCYRYFQIAQLKFMPPFDKFKNQIIKMNRAFFAACFENGFFWATQTLQTRKIYKLCWLSTLTNFEP